MHGWPGVHAAESFRPHQPCPACRMLTGSVCTRVAEWSCTFYTAAGLHNPRMTLSSRNSQLIPALRCRSCFRVDMFSKGTKRKFPGEDDEMSDENLASAKVSSSYSLQRQSLLDMSLIKLQLCHMLVEPNLCRSVLIANTVRQIQEEMTHDGSWVVTEAFCSGAQGPSERLVATEVLCRSREQESEPKLFSVISYEEISREEEVVTDETLCSVSVRDPAADVCLSETSSRQWDASEDDPPRDDEDEDEDDEQECPSSREEPKAMGQVIGTFEIKNGASGPDSALEELFSDVDASYYDLDNMLTGIQSTAPKMGPYDLLDSLSPSHTPTSINSPSNCRSDLNELEHLMEIIVGS
ncbi:cell division cycle-associated protein 4 isoform X1 [Silurus meridionalis]|uniref:cell division cycle-associated protein 4 isoform X1 n=2 Tax=Silurus meridionalis TaxID=175797 RepID=UPI001EEADAD0|nr:cell division cycle-associated protein 4 isoform X1 [Silurus meridionalis]